MLKQTIFCTIYVKELNNIDKTISSFFAKFWLSQISYMDE